MGDEHPLARLNSVQLLLAFLQKHVPTCELMCNFGIMSEHDINCFFKLFAF